MTAVNKTVRVMIQISNFEFHPFHFLHRYKVKIYEKYKLLNKTYDHDVYIMTGENRYLTIRINLTGACQSLVNQYRYIYAKNCYTGSVILMIHDFL